MEREIKFRAWDEDSKKMFEDVGLTPTECIVYKHSNKMIPPKEDWRFGRDTIALMQYTGLKDKNDKDIYEGDILMCEAFYSSKSLKKKTHKAIVKFSLGGFDPKSIDEIIVLNFDNCEVIGNIYENPDLLQGEDS